MAVEFSTTNLFKSRIFRANIPVLLLLLVIVTVTLLSRTACGETNPKDFLKRENSLIKPYTDDRWDFTGSTIVTNNYVRLTPDQKSSVGAIWNIVDWELHVHFKVHGSGKDLFGDGLVIWYTKNRLEPGPVFGSKDYFVGLAIFLDTYANQNGQHNHGHPYISAMINNGSLHYDHDRDGTHTELNGCQGHFRKVQHETYLAIRYEHNKLTVSTDFDGVNKWNPCFSVDGVRIPSGYYFGASAATGDLSDNHDIISMKLYDIGVVRKEGEGNDNIQQPSADFFASPRDHVEDPKSMFSLGGWRTFFFIVLVLVGVAVCGAVGYLIYQKQQHGSRKRFY